MQEFDFSVRDHGRGGLCRGQVDDAAQQRVVWVHGVIELLDRDAVLDQCDGRLARRDRRLQLFRNAGRRGDRFRRDDDVVEGCAAGQCHGFGDRARHDGLEADVLAEDARVDGKALRRGYVVVRPADAIHVGGGYCAREQPGVHGANAACAEDEDARLRGHVAGTAVSSSAGYR